MADLRLVKSRRRDEPTASDLRGLGEEDVFRLSSPYACLSVHGLPDSGPLAHLLEKFGLETMKSSLDKVVHLRVRGHQDGQHKLEAVTLFAAALDIAHEFSELDMHLSEISGLHLQLDKATHLRTDHSSAHGPDGHIKKWLQSPRALTLESVITWHLNQAGFRMERHEKAHHLDAKEVRGMYRELVSGAVAEEQSQSISKKSKVA